MRVSALRSKRMVVIVCVRPQEDSLPLTMEMSLAMEGMP